MVSYNIICSNPDCTDYNKVFVTERELTETECCDECGKPVETSLVGVDQAQDDPDTPKIKMCTKCREITGNKTTNDRCNCGGYLKEARVCSNPKCPQRMIPHPEINICFRSTCNGKMIPIPDDAPLLMKDSKIFNDFEKRESSTCIRGCRRNFHRLGRTRSRCSATRSKHIKNLRNLWLVDIPG